MVSWPCFRQCHLKILLLVLFVIGNLILAAQANSKIIIHRFIIEERLLNHVAPITQTHKKILKSLMGIGFHNRSENWIAAHID